jgi:hypothetical protein
MNEYRFYDLRCQVGSSDIGLLLPEWEDGHEKVMVLSPHDDDALLGAGYAILACLARGAEVHICILCDGRAGYSSPEQRETIVVTRRSETLRAYGSLGLTEGHIHSLGYPDFSLVSYIGWCLSSNREGSLRKIIPLFRRLGITRLLIPNGYREHSDHTAAYEVGCFDGVQAGDPVLADWGPTCAIRSTLQYSVWGDLSPEDALVAGANPRIRANRAIVAPYGAEDTISRAIAAWESQGEIIADLRRQRRERDCGQGMMELFLALEPRPRLDYAPYAELIRKLSLVPS